MIKLIADKQTLSSRIDQFYQDRGVRFPIDVSLHMWSDIVDVEVIRRPGATYISSFSDYHVIFIDDQTALPQRRAEIAHEIGHALLHTGNQMLMCGVSRCKQEYQADQFALYALAPTFLFSDALKKHRYDSELIVPELAEVFCVPESFMAQRIALHKKDLFYTKF